MGVLHFTFKKDLWYFLYYISQLVKIFQKMMLLPVSACHLEFWDWLGHTGSVQIFSFEHFSNPSLMQGSQVFWPGEYTCFLQIWIELDFKSNCSLYRCAHISSVLQPFLPHPLTLPFYYMSFQLLRLWRATWVLLTYCSGVFSSACSKFTMLISTKSFTILPINFRLHAQ